MFVEPPRTAYDWSFRLFGIRVRVHPLFWLGAAFLGGSTLKLGVLYMLAWILAVLVSILVHELGHALAYRLFRVESHIVLSLFFGLAVPYSSVSGRWKRILVSLAGPFAGFTLAAFIFALAIVLPVNLPPIVGFLVRILLLINIVWGLLNLLPVWPLDGGQVMTELCSMASWRHGRRIALEISLAVAGIIVVYSLACEMGRLPDIIDMLPFWLRGTYFTAILFALLAVQSYQQLQADQWNQSYWDR